MKPSTLVAAGERGIGKLGRGIANTYRRVKHSLHNELEAQRIAEGQQAEARIAERSFVEAQEIANRAEAIITARTVGEITTELRSTRRSAARYVMLGHYGIAQDLMAKAEVLDHARNELLASCPR